ncbi:FAD-binding oxidoreductase [Paracoccus sp. Z118]|uniref:NAD(P)/FAD-dependent oxidoreductase n=1 Tax=Paracoccus sp. Z118 TaxID=2851017 RepID=UPI001C2BD1C7|nr:FAD-binding oxidoreductase [Paracoccus sp. Z118]MBV0892183.1 FAD-binding oxidoreductase [Paracoccus sp. Z118]
MNTDILIIGGGIAGVSAAAELSAHASVVLLEDEEGLAHHASSRSAALYEPYYGPPPIVELSLASREGLAGADVLSPRGILLVASPSQQGLFAAEADAMHLSPIDAEEAAALFPPLDPARVAAAAKGDHASDIDTDRLVQHYARTARGNGATLLTRAPVTAIRRQGGWAVTTPQGEFTAAMLVNAAGPWADRVAAMAGVTPLGLRPHRRSMARIPAPDGMDPAGWPMTMGVGEGWYAKPDAGALIVSPCEADPMDPHDAWPDDMVLAEGLARYEAMTRFPVQRLLSSWAGLRTFAPDGDPVYGADPDAPDFVWFAGQGGYGFQSAPAAARFIADTVLRRGTDAALARALSPARFRA